VARVAVTMDAAGRMTVAVTVATLGTAGKRRSASSPKRTWQATHWHAKCTSLRTGLTAAAVEAAETDLAAAAAAVVVVPVEVGATE